MSGDQGPRHRLHIGGHVSGQVVVGNNNVVINAQGSQIFLRKDPPPSVRRRTRPESRPLPRLRTELVGREAELARLTAWLNEGVPVQVYGPPGVGKSALLRRLAVDRAAAGTDVVFLSAAGLAVDDVVQDLFQACYDAVDYLPEPAQLRRLMGSIRALVVVDDFEGTVEDLNRLLDAIPSSDLIFTTTNPLIGIEVRSLELYGLPEGPALWLIAHELGRQLGNDVAAARALCRVARGHPQALLHAAAAVRLTGAFASVTTDPDIFTRALVMGLGSATRKSLDVLCALHGLDVSPNLIRMLTGDPASAAALAELEQARLIEPTGSGYVASHAAVRVVAGGNQMPPDAGHYARPLANWARMMASPGEIADAAPVLVRVLTGAVRLGDFMSARDLARAASPSLGRTLRWGSWRAVLALGQDAAGRLGAAGDEAYFAHEEQIRRRALGLSIGLAGGAAAMLGKSAVGAKAGGKSAIASVASHPGVIAATVIAAIAATVAGVSAATGDEDPRRTAGSVVSTPPPTSTAPAPATPTESSSTRPPTSKQSSGRQPPPPGKPCPPISMGTADFGSVEPGATETRNDSFPWLRCDNERAISVQGDKGFTAALTSCPPAGDSGPCDLRVTFSSTEPGTHTARMIIPDDEGKVAVTLRLRATVSGPLPSPTDPPTPSPTDSPIVTEPPTPEPTPESSN